MNAKLIVPILAIIIIVVSVLGYLIYNGTFTTNGNPLPNPEPTPTISPTPTVIPTPTISPTPGPTPTHKATSIPTLTPTTSPSPTAIATPTASPQPVDLRIFIASSLTNIVANMTQAFNQANNCNLIVNSGSSSALYTQITSGSPCDVFMSADTKWVKQLNSSSLLYNNNYVNFTTNSLEMIIAQGNPKNITSLADLANPGVKVVLADPSIPSGSYTNTTCYKIDSTWGNTSSLAYISNGSYVNYNATMHQNVVSYETTVENVVGKVTLNVGTADAGIVFISDAVYGKLSGSLVQFIPIHATVNTRGTYGIGVIGSNSQSTLAQKFMDFWSSADGQALLTYYGFNS
jgi:molybdate transport system substrate-binding protein